MAVSRRTKKARNGKGRVRATDGGQTQRKGRDTKGNIIREGTVQHGEQGPPKGAGTAAGGKLPGSRGRLMTDADRAAAEALSLEQLKTLIFTDIGKKLFVKKLGGKSVNAGQFLKENPNFRPSSQSDLDRFQGVGLFPDFVLPADPALVPPVKEPDAGDNLLGLQGSIPNRKFITNPRFSARSGGRMTAEATAAGKGVARQKFAVGGVGARSAFSGSGVPPLGAPVSGQPIDIPGINTLPGQEQGPITQTSQTGTSSGTTEGTSESSGTGFTQGIADTGALDNIVNQLRGVQGFSNLGRSTLDDILRTGLPTDVSGITEAAKIRAGQEFDDASNVIGERLANLGLVSSSAQTTAVARERAKLGERVSAAGLEAEVAAAEAAANRRTGGVGLDTSGQRTRAGALGQAGSLAATSAGLTRREETGFNRRGSSSSTTTGDTSSQGTVSQSNPLGGTLPGGGGFAGGSRSPGGSSSRRVAGGPRPVRGGLPRQLSRSRDFNKEAFSRFADGGRVPELDDVLIGALEGSTGLDVPTLTKADRLAAERGRIARFEEDNIGLTNARKEIGEFLSVNDPGILRMLLGGGRGIDASTSVADPGTNLTPAMLATRDRAATSALERARPPVPRQHFALGGPVEGDPEPVNSPNKGAVPQPTLPQEAGQVVPGLLDPRRQFFEDGGGVAPGVDSGQDKVPAMLRAEELVVTPELTEELLNVDPGLPQPALITALQQLAQQPLKFGQEEGELVADHGGSVPGIASSQFNIPIPGAQGQTGVGPLEPFPGLQAVLDFIERQGEAKVDPATGQIVIQGGDGQVSDRTSPKFPGKFLPGAVTDFDAVLREEPDFGGGPTDFSVPGPPLRGPSFSEGVGEAGERSFTLTGGGPGTERVGAAGIRAGLDPNRGLLTGGENFVPGVSRQVPGSAGSISGSAAIIDPATGLPVDFSGEQLSRVDRAQKIAEMTRQAINIDPIGGPKKQARMLQALEIANREVDASVNEMIQEEQLAIQRQQVENQGVVAQGQLNASIAATLASKARLVTAEGALAKQVAEVAANNPVLTAALNALEILAKNPDADDQTRDQILAVMQFQLQQAGIELADTGGVFGLAAFLFGAPGFEVARSTPEQGIPTQAPNGRQGFADGGIVQPDGGTGVGGVVNDGNQELQALMSRAKAGMSAEDFQHVMEMM